MNKIFNFFMNEIFIDNNNDFLTIFYIIIFRNNRLWLIIDTIKWIGIDWSFIKINFGNDRSNVSDNREFEFISIDVNNDFDLEAIDMLLANFRFWNVRKMIIFMKSKIYSIFDCERKFLSMFVNYNLHHILSMRNKIDCFFANNFT